MNIKTTIIFLVLSLFGFGNCYSQPSSKEDFIKGNWVCVFDTVVLDVEVKGYNLYKFGIDNKVENIIVGDEDRTQFSGEWYFINDTLNCYYSIMKIKDEEKEESEDVTKNNIDDKLIVQFSDNMMILTAINGAKLIYNRCSEKEYEEYSKFPPPH